MQNQLYLYGFLMCPWSKQLFFLLLCIRIIIIIIIIITNWLISKRFYSLGVSVIESTSVLLYMIDMLYFMLYSTYCGTVYVYMIQIYETVCPFYILPCSPELMVWLIKISFLIFLFLELVFLLLGPFLLTLTIRGKLFLQSLPRTF